MVRAVIRVDARHMSVLRNLRAVSLATVAIGIAACGNDGDNEPTAPEAANATPRALAQDLGRYLMRRDEEPGFRRGAAPGATPESGGTITGVKAFVSQMRLAQPDARRLRSEGFVSYAFAPIRGRRGAAGITNIALFETAGGAQHNMEWELRTDAIRAAGPVANLHRFTVAGIPGARGWTASEPRIANLWWVQGRCVLVLGNQGPGSLIEPLSKGARAIFERTNGKCP
jgi:hypothetical protein